MKRKIVTVFLSISLCINIFGCGNAQTKEETNAQLEESQTKNEEKEQLEENSDSQNTSAITTVSNDFEKGTTEYTVGEFSIHIPTPWTENSVEDGDNLYFYPGNDTSCTLMLIYTDIPELEGATDEDKQSGLDSWANGLTKNDAVISVTNKMDTSYNGISAKSLIMRQTEKSSDQEYIVNARVFFTNHGMGQTLLSVSEDCSIDYLDDYEKILDTLCIIDETTIGKESKSKNEDSAEKSAADSNITLGQKNALSKAKDYLDYTAFSYDGLIDQLEYEGFSIEEATYAADNCDADWGEQASIKAREYLSFSAFSHSGLIEQLKYEGFTKEDATNAADNCGADWNEQASKKAQEYIDTMSFSRSGLIEQLEYEGFTKKQAEYGASAVGY